MYSPILYGLGDILFSFFVICPQWLLPEYCVNGNGFAFENISMKEFFKALEKRFQCNMTAIEDYQRICIPDSLLIQCNPKEALRMFCSDMYKICCLVTLLLAER
jgi:hypothetical protein